MKILLLGAGGQLGFELVAPLSLRGDLVCPSHAELEMSDLDAVSAALLRVKPDLVVNATAYNEVDRAESEPEAALAVNARAVAALGEYAREHRAALIHYSTDFVFDGEKGAPYVETDPPNPLSAYGRSKLAGEVALAELAAPAIVLRTAWVYSLRRKSFVSIMHRLLREKQELRVVTDQVGSPTFARDLARATATVVDRLGKVPHEGALEHRGVYHAAGTGACSRFELTSAIMELDPKKSEHTTRQILPAKAADFPAPARRPAYAPLDSTRLATRLGARLLPWREALAEALSSG